MLELQDSPVEYFEAIRTSSRVRLQEVKRHLPKDLELLVDENPEERSLQPCGEAYLVADLFNYTFSISPFNVEKKFAELLREEARKVRAQAISIASDDVFFYLTWALGKCNFYRMPSKVHDDSSSY